MLSHREIAFLKMWLQSHKFVPSRVVGARMVDGGFMTMTLKGAAGSHTILKLGSNQRIPVAGDSVPLEGTED